MVYITEVLKKIFDNILFFKVWAQERDPLGRLIEWIDRTAGKIKKFFGLKFSYLFSFVFPTYYANFFFFLENVSTCLRCSLFSLQFFIKSLKILFELIERSSLNKVAKNLFSLFLVLTVFFLFSYLIYYKFTPFITFLLSEFFYVLKNFKNPFKGKEPAFCMQRREKKKETDFDDMYKTSNSTYGNFQEQALKGAKKPFIKQWNAVQKVQSTKTLRRLSPGQENELLHQHINQGNVYEVDWDQDEPLTYAKNQLTVNTVKGALKAPATYIAIGALSAVNPKPYRSPTVQASLGGTAYYAYSGIEYAYDQQTRAAGLAIIKHQGLEVRDGCLVPGPNKEL